MTRPFTPVPSVPTGLDPELQRWASDLVQTLQVILNALSSDVALKGSPGPAPYVNLVDITGINPRPSPAQAGVVTCRDITGVAFPMLCYADTVNLVWRRADTGAAVS